MIISNKKYRRYRREYYSIVDLIVSLLSDKDYGGFDDKKIEELKIIGNGINSDNDDTRGYYEDKLMNLKDDIATENYYDFISRNYFGIKAKNKLYKVCMRSHGSLEFDELARLKIGFGRIVESALLRIAYDM